MDMKEMMKGIKRATQEQAGAVTWVYWDIKMCPVPDGFHPRLVRPSIKRLLEKNGYRGPLNVTAFGKLADVPIETLREVFSSGINLQLLPHGNMLEYIDVSYPDRANIMVISDPNAYPNSTLGLQSLGKIPIQPFPYQSLSTLLMKYSGVVGEETAESALWDCLVCARDPPGQSFATFISHLSDEEHHELLIRSLYAPRVVTPMKHVNPAFLTRESLGPVTMVYWDINSCPVPPGCDASLVGPCIKRFLKKEGCSGPLSITAIGRLTEVPNDILEGVYSSGIALNNIFYGFFDTLYSLLYGFMNSNPPPANFMVISDAKSLGTPDANSFASTIASWLKSRGYNVLQPVPCDSLSLFLLRMISALMKRVSLPSGFAQYATRIYLTKALKISPLMLLVGDINASCWTICQRFIVLLDVKKKKNNKAKLV